MVEDWKSHIVRIVTVVRQKKFGNKTSEWDTEDTIVRVYNVPLKKDRLIV